MSAKRPAEGDAEGAKFKRRWFVLPRAISSYTNSFLTSSSFTAGTEIIKVVVGKGLEVVEHQVHKNILCRCPFFEKCLSSGMKEVLEKTVKMPDDNPDDMDIIINWLYHDKIMIPNLGSSRLISTYNLANKYGLPELQNAVVDQHRLSYKARDIWPRTVLAIWRDTIEGCKFRDVALDQLHHDIVANSSRYKDTKNDQSKATQLKELMKENGELVDALFWKMEEVAELKSAYRYGVTNPAQMTGCVYHMHEAGNTCT